MNKKYFLLITALLVIMGGARAASINTNAGIVAKQLYQIRAFDQTRGALNASNKTDDGVESDGYLSACGSTINDKGYRYEFLYDHKKGMFGVVTASFKDEDKINYGKAYWGDAAVRYLESNYLDSYIASEEAYDARKKTELEREAAYPCGWAYFSEKGKGNIKYKITCEIENYKVTVVFSGFNKNDNVIDEVFVLPPAGNAIEENPNIKPPKVLYLYSYFQQGVNFAYINVEEDAYTIELYTSMDVLATIDSILNKSSKWINKTGINYYHRDRWGNEHKMQ